MSPEDMANRIVTNSERGITITVNNIEHIESQSVNGLGIIKIFFRPGTNIQTRMAQMTAICQTTVRGLPPGTTPPLIISVYRVHYSHHPTRAQQQDAAGAGIVRSWPELPAHPVWRPCPGRQRRIPMAARSARSRSISTFRETCSNAGCRRTTSWVRSMRRT